VEFFQVMFQKVSGAKVVKKELLRFKILGVIAMQL
jgi:hypothetical protein